jgi:carbamoyltransferase
MKPTIAIYGIQDRNAYPYPGHTHDHSICRMEDGEITHYLQLERWTRRKYDNQLHLHIEELIERGVIPLTEDTDLVFVNSFVGNSFLSQNGRVRFEQMPRKTLTEGAMPGFAWVETQPWSGKEYQAFAIDHELAHVCTNLPFHGAFRENSLLVHFDGGASLGNFSAYLYRKRKLEMLECHWKLAQLSKFFNDNALSFALLNHGPGEHCAVPGKLMGFATIGTPLPELQDWLRSYGWFKDMWQDHSPFYAAARADFGWEGKLGDTRDPFLQNLAACIQMEFQTVWLAYLQQLQASVQADYLYLSGGCALNIVANTQIVESSWFQDVFIPPCPGDSGLSMGAAAYLEWQKHGQVKLHSPYLNNAGLASTYHTWDHSLIQQVGEAIAQGQVVGICQGPGEAGPRALGNRSIIARPDSLELARKVSMDCKRREWYRPIAPVALEKHAKRLTDRPELHHLSRYMLLDFAIPAENHHEVAGVVHANGTARVQVLFSPQDHPFLWDLLSYLDEAHQIPALINTSFNQQGEPIVHTAQQACRSAMAMGLDALVLHGSFYPLTSTSYHELERN